MVAVGRGGVQFASGLTLAYHDIAELLWQDKSAKKSCVIRGIRNWKLDLL